MSTSYWIGLLTADGQEPEPFTEEAPIRYMEHMGHSFPREIGEALAFGSPVLEACLTPDELTTIRIPYDKYDEPARTSAEPAALRRVFAKLYECLDRNDTSFPVIHDLTLPNPYRTSYTLDPNSYAVVLVDRKPSKKQHVVNNKIPFLFRMFSRITSSIGVFPGRDMTQWIQDHWQTEGKFKKDRQARRVTFFDKAYDLDLKEFVYRIRVNKTAFIVRTEHKDVTHRNDVMVKRLGSSPDEYWVSIDPRPWLELEGVQFRVKSWSTFYRWKAHLEAAVMVCTLAESKNWTVTYHYG